MVENSKIEWCHHSFNPWTGCQKVSPACDNCYAESWAKRSGIVKWGPGEERRRTSAAYWRQPLKWNQHAKIKQDAWDAFRDSHQPLTDEDMEEQGFVKPIRPKVFCASLADVFDNAVPVEWRTYLWRLIQATRHLDWLLLTKRPQNIRKMLPDNCPAFTANPQLALWGDGWPNVWLGTTAENREEYHRRWAHVAAVPARIRFLSVEPLLGDLGDLELGRVASPNWVICGGESGPKARPMHPDWVRGLRDQCAAAGVPFFFKQMTKKTPIPEEFMIREFPQ